MERSEPSLVPEWLRSNGGGGLSHHFVSSQAGRNCSSSYRRSSSSNCSSNRHDRNPYSRSYSGSSRTQHTKDREKLGVGVTLSLEYSNRLSFSGRLENSSLGRSKSMISGRAIDSRERRTFIDLRDRTYSIHSNGNDAVPGGNGSTGIQESFEIDFPLLGSDERPTTPDIIRIPSPGLRRAVQGLSIGSSCLHVSEGCTSTLAEVPVGSVGLNSVGSSCGLQEPSDAGSCPLVPASATTSSAVALNGFNMTETLVQAPERSFSVPQQSEQAQRFEVLPFVGNKKLISLTPSKPKTMVLSSSDKLKPKTAMRSSEAPVTPKNGLHHLSPLQLSSQPVRGASVRGEGPKSPSSGKLLILKSGRENGVLPGLKDIQSPAASINNRVANGQSIGSCSAASGPAKNLHGPKMLPGERKAFGYGLNSGAGVGIRNSRSDFFKLMREKSLNNPSPTDSGAPTSSDVVDKTVKEAKDLGSAQAIPAETESELNGNGNTCTAADNFSPSMKFDNEEERAFLLSLGWDDNGEDEEGLTEEEICAFYNDVMKQGLTPRLCRVLQAKVFSNVGCSSPNEPNSPASQAEA